MTHLVPARLRGPATALLVAALCLGASGCGSEADPVASDGTTSSPTPSESSSESSESSSETAESPTEEASPEGQVIDIRVSGDEVEPNGERVDIKAGQAITLRITADEPGELHVHATPEQVLSYPAGTTEVPLTIDQPGVVEVESHDLHLVIVQLEAR